MIQKCLPPRHLLDLRARRAGRPQPREPEHPSLPLLAEQPKQGRAKHWQATRERQGCRAGHPAPCRMPPPVSRPCPGVRRPRLGLVQRSRPRCGEPHWPRRAPRPRLRATPAANRGARGSASLQPSPREAFGCAPPADLLEPPGSAGARADGSAPDPTGRTGGTRQVWQVLPTRYAQTEAVPTQEQPPCDLAHSGRQRAIARRPSNLGACPHGVAGAHASRPRPGPPRPASRTRNPRHTSLRVPSRKQEGTRNQCQPFQQLRQTSRNREKTRKASIRIASEHLPETRLSY